MSRHEQAISERRTLAVHRPGVAARAGETEGRPAPGPGSSSVGRDLVRAAEWHSVGDAPPGDGLRQWRHLLAAVTGLASRRRVAAAPSDPARPAWGRGPDRLVASVSG